MRHRRHMLPGLPEHHIPRRSPARPHENTIPVLQLLPLGLRGRRDPGIGWGVFVLGQRPVGRKQEDWRSEGAPECGGAR